MNPPCPGPRARPHHRLSADLVALIRASVPPAASETAATMSLAIDIAERAVRVCPLAARELAEAVQAAVLAGGACGCPWLVGRAWSWSALALCSRCGWRALEAVVDAQGPLDACVAEASFYLGRASLAFRTPLAGVLAGCASPGLAFLVAAGRASAGVEHAKAALRGLQELVSPETGGCPSTSVGVAVAFAVGGVLAAALDGLDGREDKVALRSMALLSFLREDRDDAVRAAAVEAIALVLGAATLGSQYVPSSCPQERDRKCLLGLLQQSPAEGQGESRLVRAAVNQVRAHDIGHAASIERASRPRQAQQPMMIEAQVTAPAPSTSPSISHKTVLDLSLFDEPKLTPRKQPSQPPDVEPPTMVEPTTRAESPRVEPQPSPPPVHHAVSASLGASELLPWTPYDRLVAGKLGVERLSFRHSPAAVTGPGESGSTPARRRTVVAAPQTVDVGVDASTSLHAKEDSVVQTDPVELTAPRSQLSPPPRRYTTLVQGGSEFSTSTSPRGGGEEHVSLSQPLAPPKEVASPRRPWWSLTDITHVKRSPPASSTARFSEPLTADSLQAIPVSAAPKHEAEAEAEAGPEPGPGSEPLRTAPFAVAAPIATATPAPPQSTASWLVEQGSVVMTTQHMDPLSVTGQVFGQSDLSGISPRGSTESVLSARDAGMGTSVSSSSSLPSLPSVRFAAPVLAEPRFHEEADPLPGPGGRDPDGTILPEIAIASTSLLSSLREIAHRSASSPSRSASRRSSSSSSWRHLIGYQVASRESLIAEFFALLGRYAPAPSASLSHRLERHLDRVSDHGLASAVTRGRAGLMSILEAVETREEALEREQGEAGRHSAAVERLLCLLRLDSSPLLQQGDLDALEHLSAWRIEEAIADKDAFRDATRDSTATLQSILREHFSTSST